jgi:hypothetical protein
MMDKVTQENAAGAGETQSLSKSLTRQAALLSEALREMNVILQGGRETRERRRASVPPREPAYLHERPPSASSGVSLPQTIQTTQKVGLDPAREQALNKALPMDDDL